MSLIKTEKGEKSSVELQFSVEKSVFEEAVNKVYHKQVKKINVPGFRKGKAPRQIIEKFYGKAVFYDDAFNDVIPAAFEAAVKEAGITPVGRPEFDVVSMDGDIVFSAKVDVKPEVEINDYRGIQADMTVAPVTDEEINAEIDILRQRNSRETEITDAPAENGNTVNIDYAGTVDGVAFEGGTAQNYNLKLGFGQFIPGFEDQIVGHNIGDEFDVNVTFPEQYQAAELAGKPAVFRTKLNKIEKIELPELDDDFAKDVSDFDTFAEYRADVVAKLEKKHSDNAEADVKNKLYDTLAEKLTGDIPESMYNAEVENYIRDYDMRLQSSGMKLDDYLKYTNTTLDDMRKQIRPSAEKRVKITLALEKIAALENIQAGEDEVSAEIKDMADKYQMPEDKVRELVAVDDIKGDIIRRKAMELVREAAEVTTK